MSARRPAVRPGRPWDPRPRPRVKKPKPRKHYAVLISRRYQSYGCPSCGPLGSLTDGIAHAVANQFDVPAP